MLPPWASTMVLVIASPRPTPGIASVSTVLPRKNLLKILPISASEMPRPVSRTRTTATSPSRPTVPSTRPPAGVYLIALLNRLSKTCESRSLSPLMSSSVTDVGCRARASSPAAAAALRASTADRSSSSVTETRSMSRTVATDCSAVESRSSTRRCSRRALRCTTVEEAARVLGQVLGVVEDHVDVADDRRQRRPQLVAHRGDELVLDPRGHDQLGDVVVGEHRAAELTGVAEVRRGGHREGTSLGRDLPDPDQVVAERLAPHRLGRGHVRRSGAG